MKKIAALLVPVLLFGACGGGAGDDKGAEALYKIELGDVHLRYLYVDEARSCYADALVLAKEAKNKAELKDRANRGLNLVEQAAEFKKAQELRLAKKNAEAEKIIIELIKNPKANAIRQNTLREFKLLNPDSETLLTKAEMLLKELGKDYQLAGFIGDILATYLDKPLEAIAHYMKVWEWDKDNLSVMDGILGLYIRVKTYDKAEGMAAKMAVHKELRDKPDILLRLYMRLASLYLADGKTDKALEMLGECDKYATTDQQREDVQVSRYQVHKEAKTLDPEIEKLKKEKNQELLYRAYSDVLQEWEKAYGVAQEVLKEKPDDAAWLRRFVVAAWNKKEKDYAGIKERVEKILAQNPDDATQVVTIYVSAVRELKKEAEAVPVLEAAAGNATTATAKAVCLIEIAVLVEEKARPDWVKKAIDACTDNAEASLVVARGLRTGKDYEGALQLVVSALALNPARDIRDALRWERIVIAEESKDLPEATKLCAELADDYTADPRLRERADAEWTKLRRAQGLSPRGE